jgi:hypothetical protein
VKLVRNHGGSFGFAVAGPIELLNHDSHDVHYVTAVNADADRAGLRVGDRVLAVDGQRCV